MKAQLAAIFLLLASTPARASVATSQSPELGVGIQPAALSSGPVAQPEVGCGPPVVMQFILRDPNGVVVAIGVADVPTRC